MSEGRKVESETKSMFVDVHAQSEEVVWEYAFCSECKDSQDNPLLGNTLR